MNYGNGQIKYNDEADNAILGLTGDKKIVSLTFLNAFNIKE